MWPIKGGEGGGEVKSSPSKIDSLGNHNGNGSEMSLENWIRAPPTLIPLILLNSVFQVLGKFCGVDSKGLFTWKWWEWGGGTQVGEVTRLAGVTACPYDLSF